MMPIGFEAVAARPRERRRRERFVAASADSLIVRRTVGEARG